MIKLLVIVTNIKVSIMFRSELIPTVTLDAHGKSIEEIYTCKKSTREIYISYMVASDIFCIIIS